MARQYTPQQQNAIEAHGGTILVSAAAGSGKTSVLIERVMRMLTDPIAPISADRLLIVTFTRAAAAEMRSRLSRAMSERIESEPQNLLLHRQKLLLSRTRIDTIHSFCSACIREFFPQAGVAPDFRIGETSELNIMRTEILAAVLEERYRDGSEGFLALSALCGDEKNTTNLEKAVLKLDSFITAFPDPDGKLSELEQMYLSGCDIAESPWGEYLMNRCERYIRLAADMCERAMCRLSEYGELSEIYMSVFEDDKDRITDLLIIAGRRDWDALYYALRSVSFKALPRTKDNPDGKKELQGLRDDIKDTVKKIAAVIPATAEQFGSDRQRLSPIVSELCDIVRRFRSLYAARKDERKLLDYDDLEHKTAELLFYRDDTGYCRTETAHTLAQRFDEILIDEYQDTNYTQDLIFRAISDDGGDVIGEGRSMFMVGDIKQSIYGFRKAVPKLFLDRFNRYAPYDKASERFPARITLDANFRSRREVTDFVNFTFSQLMTRERGGIEYNDDQKLVAGKTFPESGAMATELHLLGSDAYTDDDSRDTAEARYCGILIKKMIDGGFTVTDGDHLRPAAYGDFCIMRRSIKGAHGDAFVSQLGALGIPVSLNLDRGFFAATEINVILSLLRAIDNPLLDIPMLAALRSPIFGYDCDMLVQLRAADRKSSVYANLISLASSGDEQAQRVLSQLRDLRALAAAMPSDRLIAAIYRRTGYLAAVQAQDRGEARRLNLLMLQEHARSFEDSGFKGLGRFIRMIDRLIDQDEDYPCARVTSSSDCVTVRTMHNAKGLEFPVCIIAGLGSSGNSDTAPGGILTHNELGLGAKMYDRDRRLSYDTVTHQAVLTAKASDETDEELRVLYVAMTRAVDKLILVSSCAKNISLENSIKSAAALIFDSGINPFALGLGPTPGQWITACALRHPCGGELRGIANMTGRYVIPSDVPLDVHIVTRDVSGEYIAAAQADEPVQPDPELMREIDERLDYVYPYARLRDVPAKVTASGSHASSHDQIARSRPSFMTREGLSPTERGTALHKFMQFCDFAAARTSPEDELSRLLAKGYLGEREASAVDFDRVRAFFSGGMLDLIDRADRIEREWRFTVDLEPAMLPIFTDADCSGESVILQGECDLLLFCGDRIYIVDYKTDRTNNAQSLIDNYRSQLALYASAVRRIFAIDDIHCCIYSFALDRLIDVLV